MTCLGVLTSSDDNPNQLCHYQYAGHHGDSLSTILFRRHVFPRSVGLAVVCSDSADAGNIKATRSVDSVLSELGGDLMNWAGLLAVLRLHFPSGIFQAKVDIHYTITERHSAMSDDGRL